MRVVHDILEVVVAFGVMAMLLAVFSVIDISTAKHDPEPVAEKGLVVYVDASFIGPVEKGTLKHPFNTIQEGLDSAESGQTVLVEPGVYYGAIELKSGVVLKSRSGPAVTIIDGEGANIAVDSPFSEAPESWIEGFTIRNASNLINVKNRVSMWSTANMSISDCILYDANRGINIIAGGKADVKRSVFTALESAMSSTWSYGILVKNVTIDLVDHAFTLFDSSYKVFNSTISRSGCVAWLKSTNTSYISIISGSNNNICSCTSVTEPNSQGTFPECALDNTLEEHPMFVNPDAEDPASRDYHLQASSPLIDQGIDVGLPYYGAAPDIGAYEYVPAGATLPTGFEATAYAVNYILPESHDSAPLPEYRDEGERRRNILQATVNEVIDGLDQIDPSMPVQQQLDALTALRDRLEQDVLARADGFYGGSPSDDWITTKAEQSNVVLRLEELITQIDERINALLALTQ